MSYAMVVAILRSGNYLETNRLGMIIARLTPLCSFIKDDQGRCVEELLIEVGTSFSLTNLSCLCLRCLREKGEDKLQYSELATGWRGN